MNIVRSSAASLLFAAALIPSAASPAFAQKPTASTSPAPAAKGPPSSKDATATAPAVYKVKFVTTKGDITIEVHRDWSPNGADRFYNLVKLGYYNDIAFFRNIKGFMVQFGIHGDPKANADWRQANIQDDQPATGQSNKRGYVTFAKSGMPNSRTTQVFINQGDNGNLDAMGFTPFGKVLGDGMKVVDALFVTGENPREVQPRAQSEGNAYFKSAWPQLDYIKSASIEK